MKIIGGHGHDIFYGIDPSFYDTIPNRNLSANINGRIENVSAERVVFDQPRDAKNERLGLQNYETTEFLG